MHAGLKGAAAIAGPMTRMRYGINSETAAKGWEKTIAAIERLESEIGRAATSSGMASRSRT